MPDKKTIRAAITVLKEIRVALKDLKDEEMIVGEMYQKLDNKCEEIGKKIPGGRAALGPLSDLRQLMGDAVIEPDIMNSIMERIQGLYEYLSKQ